MGFDETSGFMHTENHFTKVVEGSFMRLRTLLVLLLALVPLTSIARARAETTPTEAAVIAAADQDHTAYTLPPAALAKAEHLKTFRTLSDFGGTLWGIVSVILILQLGIAARLRNVAVNLTKNRWGQCFIFFLEFMVLSTLLDLPLSLYEQHVQREYGLSVQGWGSWFGDLGKSFALSYIFGGLLVMLLFWLIRRFPKTWWIWIWAVVDVVVIFVVYISPIVIDPLFNKFEPLTQSNPQLVQQLEKVVAKGKGINIPPDRMFLMKASDKVTTLNAYVTGFGSSKRVVVWDTSIAKGTPDEILFIFGHEMGHYVLGHIVSSILFSFVFILVSFFLGFHLFQFLLKRFGPKWRIPTQDNWAALYVFVLVLNVIGFLGEPIQNSFSRMHEHAADVYGEEVVHGIVANPQATGQAAFDLLGENAFVAPDPNPLVEFWTGSHPPIWFRAAFAKHYDPWTPGAEPKYFKK
jgi:Zn-dependent protease with chaperone function